MTAYPAARIALNRQASLVLVLCGVVVTVVWGIYQYLGALLRGRETPTLGEAALVAVSLLFCFLMFNLRLARQSLKCWLRCRQLWQQGAWWQLFGFSCCLMPLGMFLASLTAFSDWFQLPTAVAAQRTIAFALLGGLIGFVGGLSIHLPLQQGTARVR